MPTKIDELTDSQKLVAIVKLLQQILSELETLSLDAS